MFSLVLKERVYLTSRCCFLHCGALGPSLFLDERADSPISDSTNKRMNNDIKSIGN